MSTSKSTKRFGARYGRKVRNNVNAIEKKMHAPQKCPYCKNPGSKRVAVGIWHCKKCESKFTGKAYTV